MDYKEKYEQGLECIQEILESGEEKIKMTLLKERLLPFFPELESEDEKIRKKCINFLNLHKRFHASSAEIDDCIAWLKKQKATDKEIIFRALPGTDIIAAAKQALEKIEIGKEVILSFNGAYIPVNGKTVAEICNEYFAWTEKQGKKKVSSVDFKAKDWYVSNVDGKIHNVNINFEKQGEKKSTDKVEPKFKVGDFIVNDYCMGKVMKLTNDTYLLDTGQGIPFSCEHNAHLWTIDDAKDGDVLYSLDSKQPFIFKHRNGYEQATAYCGLNIYGKFFVWNTKDCIITTDKYIPATKEHRDTLLKAMADAGYTFDFEKKELKLLISNGGDFESNNSKQKPTWSDEDENILEDIEEAIINYWHGDTQNILLDWLTSLKERLS